MNFHLDNYLSTNYLPVVIYRRSTVRHINHLLRCLPRGPTPIGKMGLDSAIAALLARGAAVNAKTHTHGATPLHVAVSWGRALAT
eukprot:SAG11_NODE_16856_length_535_cov_0.933486_1_plen_84_part_10